MLVEIDKERCVGCGRCVDDCVGSNLCLGDGKAQVKGSCILCGHCVALCPTEAVSIPSYDMDEVEPAVPLGTIDATTMLRVIKSRRSVRDYRSDTVGADAIELVLQAGRYTATAKNTQACRFIVVQDEIAQLKRLVWNGVDGLLDLPPADKPRWAKVYKLFSKNRFADPPVDFLFRNAPAVVFVAAERADDAGLAAQNMELMAASLGLGMLYNGYLCHAAGELPEVRAWLGAQDKPLQMCMLLGYPTVTYPRTAPRRAGDFILK